MNKIHKKSLVWLRRDLRLHDNTAIFNASNETSLVTLCFVFDKNILDQLNDPEDRRVEFIKTILDDIRSNLNSIQSDIWILYGDPLTEIPKLASKIKADAVYVNRDYEKYGVLRDEKVKSILNEDNINFYSFKDQVLFEADEILTQKEAPYSVFSPYRNNHLSKLTITGSGYLNYNYKKITFEKFISEKNYSLNDLGFKKTNLSSIAISTKADDIQNQIKDFKTRIDKYDRLRNFPAIKGVSYLSVHNRFGTISIREIADICLNTISSGSKSWLNELIWRDFYFQIIGNFPHVQDGLTFKEQYNNLQYENKLSFFDAWKNGMTGFPIVDSAMRQLNQTGFMHNRLRMIVASFLTKDLLIDWRWGEQYFKDKLIDYDFSANNGGWQWAASVGCDAQPWFRIFNPLLQSKKFDPEGTFIKKYIPELSMLDKKTIHDPHASKADNPSKNSYPHPIIDHSIQRKKALEMFEKVNNVVKKQH